MLVIGLDISDTVTLDPARQNNYSPPLTIAACYDTLVTMAPGQYEAVQPLLATQWVRTPDGQGWRFTLRPGVNFASGNPVTPEDWRYTFDRIRNINDQTAQYIANVAQVTVSGADSIDVTLARPHEPFLSVIAAPGFAVVEKQAVQAHGGSDQPGAGVADRAAEWLDGASAGTGAYRLAAWTRNQQIELTANPSSWRGPAHFQHIVIRHIPESAAQIRALQRGDIDAAFNLVPEQIATLATDPHVRIEALTSLDFVYMAVNANPGLNPALAQDKARQAIGWSIDYDGILGKLLGGKAVRPASFLPIGTSGSTEEIARQVGYHQDIERAKSLLQEAGLADGFAFELSYGRGAIAGISYQALARKIQADLIRSGIKARLNPMDPADLRTHFLGGKSQSVLAFWNAPAVESELWAIASIERVAKRVGFTPPADLVQLVHAAATEQDKEQQRMLWAEYQRRMVGFANLLVLFQPTYRVAVSLTIKSFPLTAAGWMADLADVTGAA